MNPDHDSHDFAGVSRSMFSRRDEADDVKFYLEPRFEKHIDDATIAALTQVYREELRPGMRVLDLMSSWISHLPPEMAFERVIGLGLNGSELARNPRLEGALVQDLNLQPELPFADASFDAVLIAVSVQYLIRPVAVFQSIRRVLRPGGVCIVSMSHRLFPEKAIRAWLLLPPQQRLELVESYFVRAGFIGPVLRRDRSPAGADPLWVLLCHRR